MRLRGDLLLGAWILVATNVLLAFAAIAMLTRMSPAIATILQQNDSSLEAIETMLATLATPPGAQGDDARRARFYEALERADQNITEADERPAVRQIHEEAEAALRGETDGLKKVIHALDTLSTINREAMRSADASAMGRGTAGAWAVVLLGLISFLFSLAFIGRLKARILRPIQEIKDTLVAAEMGDIHRRCTLEDTPTDFRQLMQSVNNLLDRVQMAGPREGLDPPTPEDT